MILNPCNMCNSNSRTLICVNACMYPEYLYINCTTCNCECTAYICITADHSTGSGMKVHVDTMHSDEAGQPVRLVYIRYSSGMIPNSTVQVLWCCTEYSCAHPGMICTDGGMPRETSIHHVYGMHLIYR